MPSLPPSDLAGPPPAGTPVPRAIAAIAEHHPVELVWQNAAGGITARIDRPTGSVFAKWNPAGSGESLAAEAGRMRWLAQAGTVPAARVPTAPVPTIPVPTVLEVRSEPGGELLVTAAIIGASIVAAEGRRDPVAAAAALGEGLRRLHALPVADCPFPAPDWTASADLIEHRDPARPGGRGDRGEAGGPGAPTDPADLVVCHGDPCAPNTLIRDGAFAGLVDLGRLGVADRWSDLAIASWSLEWNGMEEAEPAFWRAYGIEPDAARIAGWRARWDAPEGLG